jgi:hypothetical protein
VRPWRRRRLEEIARKADPPDEEPRAVNKGAILAAWRPLKPAFGSVVPPGITPIGIA